jgi:hypothetical protein
VGVQLKETVDVVTPTTPRTLGVWVSVQVELLEDS